MIKANYLLLAALLLFAVIKTNSQLLVYHVSKQVHWTHDGKKELAKRGVFLQPGHQITITPQANVMFVQKDGKSMLLDKSGNYTFNQVQLLMQKTKAESISKNFFAYVFEKFLSGEGEEKQRVAAVVYRGKAVMLSPDDSSFVFRIPLLEWKPVYTTTPHRIEIMANGVSWDTIVRNHTSLGIPSLLLPRTTETATMIQWRSYPADSKQPPPMFVFIIPAEKDRTTIQIQLAYLKNKYGTRKQMLRQMETDLFLHYATRNQ